MQRRVILGVGAVAIAVAAAIALRSAGRHEVAQQVDQNIATLVANLPPGTAITHGASDFNALTGTLTLHNVAMTRHGAPAWSADVVTVSGADGPALQDVLDPAAYPGGRPAWSDRRLLIADLSASGVHHLGEPGSPDEITIGKVTLHRLSARPFMLPPTPANLAKPELQADMALALAVDSVRMRDIVDRVVADKPGRIVVGQLALSGYDAGQFGAASLAQVSLDTPGKKPGAPIHLAAGDLDLKGADARAVLESVRRAGHADRAALTTMTYRSGDVDDLVFDVPNGPQVSVHDVHAEQMPPAADGIRSGTAAAHGLTIALAGTPMSPAAAAAVAAFGMNAVTMDINAASRTNLAAKQAEFHEDVVLHDLGTLHLKGSFSGYDAALAPPDKPLAALMDTAIDHATIAWDDAGLIGRLFATAAAQTHTTVELVRAQLAMPVLTLGLMLPEQPDAADQVTAFLNHPHTLTVTMNPPQKTTIGDVAHASAAARAHLLGVHVAATE